MGSETQANVIWCTVREGPFLMGSRADDELAWDDERPQHRLDLPTYYVSRGPVTNAQYVAFIDHQGYDDQRYWTEAGWSWRTGEREPVLSVIEDKERRQRYAQLLNRRPSTRRDLPFWWHDARWNQPDSPVVGVSWYEAMAFCAWLNEWIMTSPQQTDFQDARMKTRHLGQMTVQLPSEAEWEKAARGANGRQWPWGNQWDPALANTAESGAQSTLPVGRLPAGASTYGHLDMAGNVWEWTRSKWGLRARQIDYSYPYNPGDGREEAAGDDLRIVRGGSWADPCRRARCAERGRHIPEYSAETLGFRVVARPDSSPSALGDHRERGAPGL